jgi:uncharacterized protein (DUF1684 family)
MTDSREIQEYHDAIATWRRWREERLRAEDGWLNLVGLFWLEEGDNSFGTGSDNPVRLPEGSGPPHMGRFVRTGAVARVEVEPGVEILHRGHQVTNLSLDSDAKGKPTVLTLRSLSLHLIYRSGRLAVRVRDSESEALRQFKGLSGYPIDPDWRVEARFEAYRPVRTIPVPNFIGEPIDRECPGFVTFDIGGEECRLDAFEGRGGALFLVFGDQSNGGETYGGGRFLYTEPPSPDGRVTLDFNKAYNPPCVFTPHAACPLPPVQNKLQVAIEAGETVAGLKSAEGRL